MSGVLVIDKPKGWTSHDVVEKLKGILGKAKVGHAGTLDPFATGVLVVCVGKATRLVRFLMAADKTYVGAIRFGFATDTYDLEGKPITEPCKPELSEGDLLRAFANFTGPILQLPPLYSAKKLKGRRLYEYAREGIEVEREPIKVTVKSLKLLELSADTARFEVTCSAGTYVRTLAHDIGAFLGCGAHLVALRRTRSGSFTIEQAIPVLSDDKVIADPEHYTSRMVPLDDLLKEFPALVVSSETAVRVAHGLDFTLDKIENREAVANDVITYRVLDPSGKLLAIASKRASGRFHPYIVLAQA